jgi:hypothetical protein
MRPNSLNGSVPSVKYPPIVKFSVSDVCSKNDVPPRSSRLRYTKLESTVRYLEVELDDALELSEGLEI